MSRPREFTVSTSQTGNRRTVKVFVYDDVESMRAAATVYTGGENFSTAAAVCHGVSAYTTEDDGTFTELPLSAIVRLSKTHIAGTIVTHELVHAAQQIYLNEILLKHPDSRAINHFTAGNETFAHIVSDLYAATIQKLYDIGYYSQEQ